MTTDPDNPERLAAVTTEAEASLIAGMLEEHGIEATVTGGYTSGFKAEAPGDVQVSVRRSDLENARGVLNEIRQGSQIRDDTSSSNVEPKPAIDAQSDLICPRCRSAELYRESDRGALAFLLLGFPFFSIKNGWTCSHCGYSWKER